VATKQGALLGSDGTPDPRGETGARFTTVQTFSVSQPVRATATADVNGDGKADIIASEYSAATVSVLLGNGDGTFQPAATFAAVTTLSGLTSAILTTTASRTSWSAAPATSSACSWATGTGPSRLSAPSRRTRRLVGGGRGRQRGRQSRHRQRQSLGQPRSACCSGNGNGTFQNEQTFAAGSSPLKVVVC